MDVEKALVKAAETVSGVSGIASTAISIVDAISGGGGQYVAELKRQKVQQLLEKRGYNQFSKMSGWKGDEEAKLEAMKIVFAAVVGNPDRVQEVTSFLEGGKITPGTIEKIESRLPTNTGQLKPEPAPTGSMDPMAATPRRTNGAGLGRNGAGSIPVWVWAGGAVLVGGIAYLATQGRP